MNTSILKGALLSALIFSGAMAAGQAALADGERNYRITIRSALLGQPVAPSLFVTHNSEFTMFRIGEAASTELATMAETGNPGLLLGVVSADDGVSDAVILPFSTTRPVLLPGESNSAEISAEGDAKYFSAVGMLAATNDGFYAVRGVALPKKGSITVQATVYDAGSEANTENLNEFPVGGNAAFDSPAGDGEGYIHVHAGVHGVGNFLLPEVHDWRNPAVEITITRLGDDDDD